MLETWQTDSSLTSIERQMISAAHIDLVRAVLGGALEREKQQDGDTDHIRRIAALRYVETHLPFGRISATQTAHYLGVSVRALHALFERSNTTFGALVRQSRLEACRRDLADPRNDSSIAAIAAMWGYADSAHLAKAFRAQFDCSPSDYRSTQQHDTGP